MRSKKEYSRGNKNIHEFLSYYSTERMRIKLFLLIGNVLFIVHNWYRGRCRSGDARSQGNRSDDIDVICAKFSVFRKNYNENDTFMPWCSRFAWVLLCFLHKYLYYWPSVLQNGLPNYQIPIGLLWYFVIVLVINPGLKFWKVFCSFCIQ